MRYRVWQKEDIIYFDLGVLRAGDIDDIIIEATELIREMKEPFYSVSILDLMVESHVLLHPDDVHKFRELGAYMNSIGRVLSVWVVPEGSMQYHTSLQTIPQGGVMRRVDSLEQAEELIESMKAGCYKS